MVLNAITPLVTSDDNNKLTAPFTFDEFEDAIFSMQTDKCSCPNGFNPRFYQHFWYMCGHEIYTAGCSWFKSGSFSSTLNSTNIAFIPKGDNQTSVKD
jgi:hypothetical protein